MLAPCPAQTQPAPGSSAQDQSDLARRQREQLKRQEAQRVLGVIPNFNTSFDPNAPPLTRGQKFHLAFHSAVDPFQFVAAAADAGFSQAQNGFKGYGQGAQGYAKRFGASYLDNFDETMIGNGLLPVLLHQDPRYFRKGSGKFSERFLYALVSSVRCRDDHGKWEPNYSNLLGSVATGGISNLYYPASDRGLGLTLERAMTEVAEGAIGSVFVEFWPDISRKLSRNHH